MVQEAVTGAEVPFTNSITTRSAVKLDYESTFLTGQNILLKFMSWQESVCEAQLKFVYSRALCVKSYTSKFLRRP